MDLDTFVSLNYSTEPLTKIESHISKPILMNYFQSIEDDYSLQNCNEISSTSDFIWFDAYNSIDRVPCGSLKRYNMSVSKHLIYFLIVLIFISILISK